MGVSWEPGRAQAPVRSDYGTSRKGAADARCLTHEGSPRGCRLPESTKQRIGEDPALFSLLTLSLPAVSSNDG